MAGAFALRFDGSAVHGNQLLDECEADAEAAARAVEMIFDLSEQLENFALLIQRNADAGVGDGDNGFSVDLSQRYGDAAAVGRIFGGVVEEIADDLRQPRRVDVEPDRLLWKLDFERMARLTRSTAGWLRARIAMISAAAMFAGAARSCLG